MLEFCSVKKFTVRQIAYNFLRITPICYVNVGSYTTAEDTIAFFEHICLKIFTFQEVLEFSFCWMVVDVERLHLFLISKVLLFLLQIYARESFYE